MKNNIDDIFKDKFDQFEAPVSDGLWDKIQQNPGWQQHLRRQKIRNLSVYAVLAVIVISSCAVLLHQRHNTNNQDIETSVVEEEILTENIQEATTNQPNSNADAMPIVTTDETVAPAVPATETIVTPTPSTATETIIQTEDKSNSTAPEMTEPSTPKSNPASSEKTSEKASNKTTPSQTSESDNKSNSNNPANNEPPVTTPDAGGNESLSASPFSIPNAFTPNGDGLNDIFKPVTTASIMQYQLDIFAVSGQHIFTSRNLEYGWNGEFQGGMMNSGNYIYVIKYKDSNGKEHIDKGQLLLIR